ncbi:FUSC family protein [Sporosarcina aquimarina]|uniref:FUSC family protein n=1 Tax=Sporosarcina aquimarina TaxID=114975 RepID=UPI001C8D6508|nr:FUSC family protein [Sporosarcina aquimarina]MBY0221551.1 FUSC family protein [Sporosarcina aquimarina]
MKLTKKMILTNTLLFIFILGFVLGFGAVFGSENILIGVSTITAMLMLLERDLTSHPIRNTMKFVVLNLFIGIAAFLTGFNMWLAIPINFIAMFVISYSLLFNLKNPLYFPFSLQYVFILAMPVAADQMPLRLASLAFGALAIMGMQMLANKNRITKSGDQKVQTICTALIEKMRLLQKGEPLEEITEQITSDISGLRGIVYDKREENYFLTEEGRLKLNISVALEKIDILLDEISEEEMREVMLQDIIQCLELAIGGLQDKETMTLLEDTFDQMLHKYKAERNHNIVVLRMLNHIGFLKDNLAELSNLGKEHYNVVKRLEQIPQKFQKLTISETPSHTNSIKLSYAIRMAVGISLTGFMIDFFDLVEGRWMMFTVLSVIIPLYEQSQKKMRDRIFATTIGAVAVTILFMIFQSYTARSVLLMMAGYLMSYVKAYRYNTILVTFSAIGAVALVTGTTEVLTLERVAFVVAGVILASLINKFILPYKLEDANRDLWSMYNDTVHEMLVEAKEKVKGGGDQHAIKNLLLITTMIEDRLKLNNQDTPSTDGVAWLKHQRRAANTLYELYGWIDQHGLQESNIPAVNMGLQVLLEESIQETGLRQAIVEMEQVIHSTPRIEDRMVLSMILEVMEEKYSAMLTR